MGQAHELRAGYKPTIAEYRHMLREIFGARRYRIDRIGRISAYGRMPNTDATGWHNYGRVGCPETMDRLFGDKNL